MPAHPVTAYARRVVAGKVVAGRYVRLACERHLRDLNREDLVFDPEVGNRALDFFPDLLRFTKGEHAGKRFVLEPWQQFVVGSLFGWLRGDVRRFRSALILVGKKNGKTELAAGVGVYGLVGDGIMQPCEDCDGDGCSACDGRGERWRVEPGAEIYSAATTRDQASLVWRAGKAMRDRSPALKRHVGASNRRDASGHPTGGMFVPGTGSSFAPLGRDRDSTDGINPHIAIIDELHRHKSRDLYDVLTASNISRRQPLAIAISTAGAEAAGVCWSEREFAIKVLEQQAAKDDHFAFLAEIDEDDDWEDETCWPKANPNLGVSVSIEALRAKARKAQASPPDRAAFIRYHANRYTSDPEEVFLLPQIWAQCDAEPRRRGPCFVGVDLAARTDWCAVAMYWPSTHSLDWQFFLPGEDVEKREERDRVPIREWAKGGLVELCDGPVIDTRIVRRFLTGVHEGQQLGGGLAERFDVQEIAVDRALATQLLVELGEDGVDVVPFGQGYLSMSPASREFEALAVGQKLRHGNHPIATWMLSNTRVTRDPHDNIKPVKFDGKRGRRRIDGIVAAIMAVGRAALRGGSGSVYDERDPIWVPG